MKNKFFKIFTLLIFVPVLVLSSCGDGSSNSTTTPPLHSNFIPHKKLNEDWTVLVYICGSDLESDDLDEGGGSASKSIFEMTLAENFENKNIIFQTGGTKEWHFQEIQTEAQENTNIDSIKWYKTVDGNEVPQDDNYNFPSNKLGRYKVEKGRIEILGELENADTCAPETITDFVTWGLEKYPAKHTALIFWNHGSGGAGGFGSDENFLDGNGTESTIFTEKIGEALKAASLSKKLDFIGFDACLMGCYECAVTFSPYAEKLIASEEVEPSSSWDWKTTLEALDWTDYYKIIIDSFAEKCEDFEDSADKEEMKKLYANYTLSCIDLSESKIAALKARINYLTTKYAISGDGDEDAVKISEAIKKSNEFGTDPNILGHSEMYDIGNIFSNLGESINLPVLYTRNGKPHASATGLSIYFPHCIQTDIDNYLDRLGTDFSEYKDYVKSYSDYCVNIATKDLKDEDIFKNKTINKEDASVIIDFDEDFFNKYMKEPIVALVSVDASDKIHFYGFDEPIFTKNYTNYSYTINLSKSWICFENGEKNFIYAVIVDTIGDKYVSYMIPVKIGEKTGSLSAIYDCETKDIYIIGVIYDSDNKDVAQRLSEIPKNAQIEFSKPQILKGEAEELDFESDGYYAPVTYKEELLSFEDLPEGTYGNFIGAYDLGGNPHLAALVAYDIDENGNLTNIELNNDE